jgi:hypothetical protein
MISSVIDKMSNKQSHVSAYVSSVKKPLLDLKHQFTNLKWEEDAVSEFLQNVELVVNKVLDLKI